MLLRYLRILAQSEHFFPISRISVHIFPESLDLVQRPKTHAFLLTNSF